MSLGVQGWGEVVDEEGRREGLVWRGMAGTVGEGNGEPFVRRGFGGGGGGARFPVVILGGGGEMGWSVVDGGGDFIVEGGGFIPPRLTFVNRDFKSLRPFLPVGVDSCGTGEVGSVVSVGAGRNLLATAYPALTSLHPRLFGSLFHFCPRLVAVARSCRLGGDLSCEGGRILFATLSPAFASAKEILFGSVLYF